MTRRRRSPIINSNLSVNLRPKPIFAEDEVKDDDKDESELIDEEFGEGALQQEGGEAQIPKCVKDPGEPPEKEKLVHSKTHLPYRSWCKHCVMGKAKAKPHFNSTPDMKATTTVPVVGVDYAFAGNTNADNEEWAELKIMVMKDEKSKYLFAIPVPVKGTGEDEWAVKRMIQALEFLGYSELLMKSDQESG